MLKIMPA